MNQILVTGGAGFIGSHLVDQLVKKDYQVKVIDNLEKQVHSRFPDYLNPKADYYFGKINPEIKFEDIVTDTDVIFHCASKVGVAQSQVEIFDFIDKNIQSTAYMLDSIRKKDVEKIILSASMAPYGEGAYHCKEHGIVYPDKRKINDLEKKDFECKCPICGIQVTHIPIKEEFDFNGLSYYAITKQTQESMIHLFGSLYGLKTFSLRYFSVFGSRQTLGNPYAGPLPIFIDRIFNNKQPLIFEDGKQTRDFVHVSDVVHANLLAMNSSQKQVTCNIGTGKSTTIYELAEQLLEILSSDLKPRVTNDFRVGDIRHSLADIQKAKKLLNYTPSMSFKKGLEEVVDWAQKMVKK